MQFLVGLIAIILVISVVLQILVFFLKLVFAMLPAWGTAVLFILLSQYLLRSSRVEALNSYRTLSKMVTVSLDKNSNKLNWSFDESQLEIYIYNNATISVLLSIGIGVISLVIIVPMLYQNRIPWNKIQPQIGQEWGYIVSGTIVLIILLISNPKESIKKSIRERLNHLDSKVNTQLERIDDLLLLEKSIKSAASKLKISFPIDYQIDIQRYISTNKVELLSDSAGLNSLIAKNIKQASEDSSRLEKALKLYQSAEGFYKQVSYEAIKTGSMPFVKILEDVYERLNSENVRSLLITRKWKEYDDVINTTLEILKDLHEQAAAYQEEGYEKEKTIYMEETDVEKAYRILGIPSTATNEQIKKTWKIIVQTWHPDGKEGKEKEEHEAQCKEINWAYTILREARNIT